MTEISHGTNTKAFRTRATFDPVKQQFILHTPDFEVFENLWFYFGCGFLNYRNVIH